MLKNSIRFLGIAALSLFLLACSDPKKPSNSTFKAAIQAYLDTQPTCLIAMLPYDSADRGGQHQPEPSLEPLVKVGIVSVTAGQVIPHNIFDPGNKTPVPGLHYELTAKGKPFLSKEPDKSSMMMGPATETLCYAKRQVVEVVRYTEPSAAFGQTMSEVVYKFKLVDMADWAKDPAAKENSLRNMFNDDTKIYDGKQALVLMSDGWRVPNQ